MQNHRLIDERSLALGKAVAERLRREPDLVRLAQANIERWSKTCSPRGRSTLEEWAAVLGGPIEETIALLIGDDERAVRLRQSNPFAGALPQKVRNEILLQFQARDQTAT